MEQLKTLIYEERSGVAWIWINRPDKKNAISREVGNELSEVVRSLQARNDIRSVVFTSRAMSSAPGWISKKIRSSLRKKLSFIRSMNQLFFEIYELPMPTIAMLQGPALGGGCELSLCTDFRIAAEDTFVCLPETGLGLIPGWGGTQRLPLLIGQSRAKYMIYTSERIPVKTAAEWGLVTKAVPADQLESETQAFIEKIGANGPLAVRQAKQAIQNVLWIDSMNEGLKFESDCFSALIHSEDRLEALKAFSEKRRPVFKGQ